MRTAVRRAEAGSGTDTRQRRHTATRKSHLISSNGTHMPKTQINMGKYLLMWYSDAYLHQIVVTSIHFRRGTYLISQLVCLEFRYLLNEPSNFFYNFINVFGVPQGTKLVTHEITTRAHKVYTVKQQLLSANIKLIIAGVVCWEGTQQTLTPTWQQIKWGVKYLSIVTAIT